ncbi:MAG: sodium/solute symporter [Planctomycetaceae bacterium]|nr:sodium/solute symporter [Planctomycetaceae bacterium]
MTFTPVLADIAPAMHPLDNFVFTAYIIVLLAIGGIVSYRRRHSQDLFLGDRSMDWGNVGLSIFGTNIGPTFLIATCGAGYTTGMVTANFEWMAWVFLLLLGMVFVPYYLNTKIATMPEFMLKRFGQGCYTFMAFYSLLGTVILWVGGTLFAGGALLSQLIGWDLMTAIWVQAVVAASFTITGGLVAVMVTDSFQSILMIIGAAVLSIIAASHIGSLDAILNVRCGSTPPELTWKLLHPAGSDNPWYAFVLGYPVLSLWFWCSDQTIVQRTLGARNLKHAQGGTLLVAFLKILTPFLFLFPGIFAAQLLPGISDDKEVFFKLVHTYLAPGLVGLIISVLVSAVISTLSAGLNSFSTIFTLDIWKRWIEPAAGERRLKRIGQVVTLASALIAIVFAWLLSKAEGTNLFNLFQGIIGYMAPPVSAVFALGIFWKRATARAALWTLIFGSAVSLSVGICDITNCFADATGRDIFPHFLLLSFLLFAGILIFMLIMSLVTAHSPEETELPTLRQTYGSDPGLGRMGVVGWGILAIIMIGIYLFFQFAMKGS